jgi:hypothetical protein
MEGERERIWWRIRAGWRRRQQSGGGRSGALVGGDLGKLGSERVGEKGTKEDRFAKKRERVSTRRTPQPVCFAPAHGSLLLFFTFFRFFFSVFRFYFFKS